MSRLEGTVHGGGVQLVAHDAKAFAIGAKKGTQRGRGPRASFGRGPYPGSVPCARSEEQQARTRLYPHAFPRSAMLRFQGPTAQARDKGFGDPLVLVKKTGHESADRTAEFESNAAQAANYQGMAP